MERMKAAVLAGPRQLVIKDMPRPQVKPGEMEIKVSACGVCGSDVHLWKAGKGWAKDEIPDFVMGHEFCGVVTNPGDSDFKVGDRVAFWANLYDGTCDMCREGKEELCRSVNGTNYIGFVANGAYAEYFVGKAGNACLLPDNVSNLAAGLIDPLMVAYHAIRNSGIRLSDRVLVIGNGIIGNMIAELAKKSGAEYVALAKLNDVKLAPTKKAGFVDAYFNSADADVLEKMRQATPSGFDLVFEAVGGESSVDLAIQAVKPGSSIIIIGNSLAEKIPVNINRIVLQEIKLVGSVSCTRAEFEGTIKLISDGVIDPVRYVTDVIPLEKLQKTMERLDNPNDPILKAVVKY